MSEAFTQEQQEAIARRSGPLALAASAGSGKTSVLVERYVRAVSEDGIAPGKILAITFTDRAAGELRERVRMRLAAAGEREAARESVGAFVSTFHGFCARLVRAHAARGRSPSASRWLVTTPSRRRRPWRGPRQRWTPSWRTRAAPRRSTARSS